MKLGYTPKSCFHFLHLTHTGTRTVDGKVGFLKTSVLPQVGDEESITYIHQVEHNETLFNVVQKLKLQGEVSK
jgi:hypothetical protein